LKFKTILPTTAFDLLV